MIAIGNVESIHLFVGTHEVNKVYLGDTQIYPRLPKRLIFNPSTPCYTDHTSKSFLVNVNTDLRYWFVNVDQGNEFCSVEYVNNSSFRITVTANPNSSNRNARIGIYVNPNERISYFELVQTYNDNFVLDPPTGEEVTYEANTLQVDVIQDSYPDWFVTKGNETWFSVTKRSDDSGFNIVFNANTDNVSRTANINVYKEAGSTPIVYQVVQIAEPYFNVSPQSFNFNSNANTGTLIINTNIEYVYASSDPWITYEEISGTNRLLVKVSANTGSQRSGDITFTTELGDTVVSIVQAAQKEVVAMTLEYKFWDKNFALVSNKAITTPFTLEGIIEYDSYEEDGHKSVSFSKNITSGFTSGILNQEIAKDAYNIVVIANTFETATQIIDITEIGTAFSINPLPPYNFSKNGGLEEIDTILQGNATAFNVSVISGSLFCLAYEDNGKIVIEVDSNDTASARTAEIKINVIISGTEREFAILDVNQAAGDVQFSVTFNKPTTNLPAAGDNGTFTVVSNVPWHTQLISGSGVTINDTNKTWTISENTGLDARSATIVFINDNDNTVLYTQQFSQLGAAPTFSVRFIDIELESLDSDPHNGYAEVTSNIPWKVEADENWITVDDEPARYDVGIWVSANTSSSSRSGHIIFKNLYTDEVLYTKNVYQSGSTPPPPPTKDDCYINIYWNGGQKTVYDMDVNPGENITISYTVEFDWNGRHESYNSSGTTDGAGTGKLLNDEFPVGASYVEYSNVTANPSETDTHIIHVSSS